MDNTYNVHEPSLLDTVIDIEKTSLKLKEIRIKKNLKVSDLQKEFQFENPQAIYLWENPNKKTLPSLDNLVRLAKLYNTSTDELIVIKLSAINLSLYRNLYYHHHITFHKMLLTL